MQTVPDLIQRRQEAAAIAEQCIQLLQQELGVSEVILFGSLRGDSPWHSQSDLDLAVRGVSEEALWQAYQKLAPQMPAWLKLDLVDLDTVSPQIRSRILQQQPMPTNSYLTLQTQINDERISLERNMSTLNDLLSQAETIPEIALVPALASYITGFYMGCERISERVAVALDGGVPIGSNWHEQLLRQVADPGGENRPPVWQGSLLLELNEYRRFRHIDHHRYKHELKLSRVLELAQMAQQSYLKIQQDLNQFNQWLEQQAQKNSQP
jgi:predicted nucleotidyltransferase/sulfur carrier protein ThiS